MKKGVSFVKEHRDHNIMVCLTKSEYERLAEIALKNGLSNSSYCRQVLMSAIRKVEKEHFTKEAE